MDYMMELSGKSENEIFEDLKGVIFLNPVSYTHLDVYKRQVLSWFISRPLERLNLCPSVTIFFDTLYNPVIGIICSEIFQSYRLIAVSYTHLQAHFRLSTASD